MLNNAVRVGLTLSLFTLVAGLYGCDSQASDASLGGAGQGGAPAQAEACGFPVTTEQCAACVESTCCGVVQGCADNPACNTLVHCLADCSGSDCDACRDAADDDAKDQYADLRDCMSDDCEDACSSSGQSSSTTSTSSGGPPAAHCTGTPPPCSGFDNSDICFSLQGCSREYVCTGSVHSCDGLGEGNCTYQVGCTWIYVSSGPDYCTGSAASCSSIEYSECYDQEGCDDEVLCVGTTTPCAEIQTESACENQQGCSWH